jgi:iron complex outermembrane receptor protein
MLAGACGLALSSVGTTVARADASTAQVNLGVGQAAAEQSESVVVKYKARLLKEKNSPSAVTELGKQAIAATGVTGSAATLLRQAPSVYVYSQGLGDNAPEFTIRGLRGLEIATTLDGVPTQDLEAPGSFYLANNIGAPFTLNQISGVSLYPGVAYPDKNTFGTIGGTIAYDSKRPTNDFYLDVNGSIGSFGVAKGGFELNSGAMDSVFGTGDNALKVLLNYENLQAQGYIDGTSSRENEMEFALDKPYDDGLSKFQWTVIYNTADGLIQNEPVPIPYLQKYGEFSNYPTNLDFGFQRNDYFTTILKDDTYVNDYLSVGLTAFYLYNDNQLETYAAPEILVPATSNGPLSLPYGGGYIHPFVNNFGGFGYPAYLFGPPTPEPLGLFGGGYGGYFYGTGHKYNPYALYPAGSPDCPANYANNVWGGRINAPCGLNDQITGGHNDTYGIQPRATIIVPEIFGIANTIKVGALIAKETSPSGYEYLGGSPQTPFTPDHAFGDGSGGTEREIFQGYIQDKIDFLDNTLHVTPGLTVEGTHSAFKGDDVFGSKQAGAYGPNGYFVGLGTNIDQYGPFKATKWDREYLPFANVTYDFDKVLPTLAGLSAYGSFGTSALFAPVGDFGPNTAGPPPYASIVHLYEGGVKYDTSNLLLRVDYFYQKVDRDFGFFSFQSGPQNGQSEYSNFGQRETKGVEGTASWQVTPEIQLFANASHLLAKYLTSGDAFDTVAEDQYGTAFKGAPETGIPDVVSTFGVDYSHKSTFVDNDAADIRFQGTYTGHQATTYDLGGTAYLNVPNFPGLEPLNFNGCPGNPGTTGSCLAYTRYNQITGATVYDPHGGISPFTVFNLDANYTLPTPQLPVLKHVVFDLNIQNLFDQRYFQYFYKQISPNNCGTIKSGPFIGLPANNYSCTPSYSDAIPGEPFAVTFTVTARF